MVFEDRFREVACIIADMPEDPVSFVFSDEIIQRGQLMGRGDGDFAETAKSAQGRVAVRCGSRQGAGVEEEKPGIIQPRMMEKLIERKGSTRRFCLTLSLHHARKGRSGGQDCTKNRLFTARNPLLTQQIVLLVESTGKITGTCIAISMLFVYFYPKFNGSLTGN